MAYVPAVNVICQCHFIVFRLLFIGVDIFSFYYVLECFSVFSCSVVS